MQPLRSGIRRRNSFSYGMAAINRVIVMARRFVDASQDVSERDIVSQRWREMQNNQEYYDPRQDVRDFFAGIGLFILILIVVGIFAYISLRADKEHTQHKTYNHECTNSE